MPFIDEETGKMVNIYATYKGFSRLDTPETRAKAGLIEIPNDEPPAEFAEHSDWYFVTEDWEATKRPYAIYTRKPDEMIAASEKVKTNERSRRYLQETDWYVSRFSETGVAIPEDIKAKRQAAREAVVEVQS